MSPVARLMRAGVRTYQRFADGRPSPCRTRRRVPSTPLKRSSSTAPSEVAGTPPAACAGVTRGAATAMTRSHRPGALMFDLIAQVLAFFYSLVPSYGSRSSCSRWP